MRADGVDESSYAVDATRGAVDASPRRLEQQIVGDDKTTAWLKDFKENHTDTTVASRARTKSMRRPLVDLLTGLIHCHGPERCQTR